MAFARIKKALGFDTETETKSVTLTDPEAFALFGALPTHSGVNVSAASAMRVPAVACAVGLIADTLGALPTKLYDRATKAEVTDHPAYTLLHDEANEWTSAGALRGALTLDALTRDAGGFALVTRYGDDRPAELHHLDAAKVRLDAKPDGEPFYIVGTDRGDVRHDYRDVLHLRASTGLSPLTSAREAIGLALQFERHIANVFRNGGRPSGIIKSPKILDVEAKKRIGASWFNTHNGANSGNTAVLDEGMDYVPIAMSLADTQFAENRLEQIREIARAFRVPPTMLFELTRGTWSNTEEMGRQFYSLTLKPWIRAWEWAYSRALLTAEDRRRLRIEFVVDDLLTADLATRAAAYSTYRAAGIMSANEARAGLNLPAHPDGNSLSSPHVTTNTAPPTETEAPE